MDVPEDIRDEAEAITAKLCDIWLWDSLKREEATRFIAQALLSERLAQKERDAKIAYEAALYSGCPADFIAEEIAEAVRNQALGGTAYRTQGEDA